MALKITTLDSVDVNYLIKDSPEDFLLDFQDEEGTQLQNIIQLSTRRIWSRPETVGQLQYVLSGLHSNPPKDRTVIVLDLRYPSTILFDLNALLRLKIFSEEVQTDINFLTDHLLECYRESLH